MALTISADQHLGTDELGALEPRARRRGLLEGDAERQAGGPEAQGRHAQQRRLAEQGRPRRPQSGGRQGHQRRLAEQGRAAQAGETGGLQSGLRDEGRAAQGGDGRGLQPRERLRAEERGAHQGCGALGLQCRLAKDEEAR